MGSQLRLRIEMPLDDSRRIQEALSVEYIRATSRFRFSNLASSRKQGHPELQPFQWAEQLTILGLEAHAPKLSGYARPSYAYRVSATAERAVPLCDASQGIARKPYLLIL